MNPPNVAGASPVTVPETRGSRDGPASIILSSFGATAKKILQEKDLTQVLKVICEEACRVIGADQSHVVQVSIGEFVHRKNLY
jgi:hypothetical protein